MIWTIDKRGGALLPAQDRMRRQLAPIGDVQGTGLSAAPRHGSTSVLAGVSGPAVSRPVARNGMNDNAFGTTVTAPPPREAPV